MEGQKIEEDWPDIIGEEESHPEYGRISDAVGELTAALLDAKINGLLSTPIANDINGFLDGAKKSLENPPAKS